MGFRPFLCGKCGNWYIQLPLAEGVMCRNCAEGMHAPNAAGVVDCHFGHTSTTPSETKMAALLAQCQSVQGEVVNAERQISSAKSMESVKGVMSRLEQSFAKVELAQAEIPEVLRWASVMELPGMAGSPREARFKNIDAIRDLVGSNRRPPEDLAMLERSDRTCREIAAEIPSLLSDARMGLGQARQVAEHWKPKEEPQDRMAKVRAARKPREAVAV